MLRVLRSHAESGISIQQVRCGGEVQGSDLLGPQRSMMLTTGVLRPDLQGSWHLNCAGLARSWLRGANLHGAKGSRG